MDDVGIGHNSAEGVAADQLKAFIERAERVLTEIEDLKGDVKDILAEAKGNGFDVKVIRKLIAERRKDYAQRQEEAAIYELYASALGML